MGALWAFVQNHPVWALTLWIAAIGLAGMLAESAKRLK